MSARRCTDADVQALLDDPSLIEELITAFEHGDRNCMEYAAECMEKVAARKPELLAPYCPVVLELIGSAGSWLVKLRVARMIPRLPLSGGQRLHAFELMRGYLSEKSSIVRTWAMQAMFELSRKDAALRDDVLDVIDHALAGGTAAMKARARHLRRAIEER